MFELYDKNALQIGYYFRVDSYQPLSYSNYIIGSIMGSENKKIQIKNRQRKAAYKAWATIRNKTREKASINSQKIERYFRLSQISTIKHPEIQNESTLKITSYGKGIVSLFDKTPQDIACGRFWEVRWAYGCPLDCNYCYLRGTMRGKMNPSPLKTEHVFKAIEEAFSKITIPSIFNTGELSDSLMYPSLMEKIVDKFEEQDKHKVALLSKMGIRNIDFLLKKSRKQTICAWSVNATEVSKRWEKAAVPPDERIQAAKMVSEVGYDTRIRIDPIFPIFEWKKHYEKIIEKIFSALEPKRIILGTPRGLWKTIKYAREANIDMTWENYFNEDSGWGKKLAFKQRKEIYQFFYDKLNSAGYDSNKISMCKETNNMWASLDKNHTELTCNCYGPNAFN
jgi:spore photoproduct lyase